MEFYKSFEGFKKIENSKELTTYQIFELLEKYKENFDALEIDDDSVMIDLIGAYRVYVQVSKNEIIIKRATDEENFKTEDSSLEKGKTLLLADCDRFIDQLYDFLMDYIKNGKITEEITFSKGTYYIRQYREGVFLTTLSGNHFSIENENGRRILDARNNRINKTFSVQDVTSKQMVVSICYRDVNDNIFFINTNHFDSFEMVHDDSSIDKTIFKGTVSGKELKLTADYSDNHYMVELGEIVIGTFDCTDPTIKTEYKVQVHNLEKSYLVFAMVILSDIFNAKEGRGFEN